jgi:DNA-directed RNA polymerase specialized sigma24 family protein
MDRPRPPRPRALPPIVVDSFRDTAPAVSEAELVRRLEVALADLPADERTAVVAAIGYAEGPVGAAMEIEQDTEVAAALAERGLARLRAALAAYEELEG